MGLVNFLIDHINRGTAGDIAAQAQAGQIAPADTAAAYTQQTGLPAGDLFGGVQQSALAKLASDPNFIQKPYQDQLVDLAKIDPTNAVSNLQKLSQNKAMWGGITGQPAAQGGAATPQMPAQYGSVTSTASGDGAPDAPVPQGYGAAQPQQQGSALANLARVGATTGLFSPADAMGMAAKQTEMAKQQADTDLARANVPKAVAETAKAGADVQKTNFDMGIPVGATAPASSGQPAAGSTNSLSLSQLHTRIQAAENAPGDPAAVGDGGQATGLMQTHPAAFAEGASFAGIKNPNPDNPAHQMLAGQGYYDKQLATFKDPVVATVAYNAGPEVAKKWNGDPSTLPVQTQNYLGKVFPEQFGQQQTAPLPPIASDGKPFIPDVSKAYYQPDPSGQPKVDLTPQSQTKLGQEQASKNMGTRIDAINKGNEAFTTSLSSLQNEQYRLKELADIYKQTQAGTATAQNIDLVNKAVGLGLIKDPSELKNIGNLQAATGNAIMQIISQVKDTNNNMGAAPTRLFGSEINEMMEKGGDNIGSQPEALHRLITEALGFVNHHIDMVNGWTAIGGPGNRMQNGNTMLPDDYAQKFMQNHDLGDYEKSARETVGPFKGMQQASAGQSPAQQPTTNNPVTKHYVRGSDGRLVLQ